MFNLQEKVLVLELLNKQRQAQLARARLTSEALVGHSLAQELKELVVRLFHSARKTPRALEQADRAGKIWLAA